MRRPAIRSTAHDPIPSYRNLKDNLSPKYMFPVDTMLNKTASFQKEAMRTQVALYFGTTNNVVGSYM